MVATSGARLLKSAAIKVLKERLLPLATLVTPNLAEAEILIGQKLASVENMRAAAREIHKRFGCAALVKGGHLRGEAARRWIYFFDGRTELLLTAPFIKGVRTHGTGCTYSAAITPRWRWATICRGRWDGQTITSPKPSPAVIASGNILH